MVTVTIKCEIDEERVQDLLCCALEGGSNYWYQIREFRYPEGQTKESLEIEFPHLDLPFKGGCLIIDCGESELDGKVLDKAAMERGLQLMAEQYPKHWDDFLAENEDVCTGDVFLQLALFGEVVFGTDKIKCPDCGEELEEVLVEKYIYKTFRIDYEGKKMVPVYPGEWEVDDDRAYRCPHCDSLNVDEALSRYQLDESVDPAG